MEDINDGVYFKLLKTFTRRVICSHDRRMSSIYMITSWFRKQALLLIKHGDLTTLDFKKCNSGKISENLER